ncbi:MAG: glycosyltransferase N-terminal domain-containing protein [Pseudomonadota bacterium]
MNNILIVTPTIGEVVQSHRLVDDLKSIFGCNVFALVDDADSFDLACRISAIDKVYIYKNDTEKKAASFLGEVDPDLIVFIENCYYPFLLLETRRNNKVSMLISAVMNKDVLHHPKYELCFLMGAYKIFSYIGVKYFRYRKEFVDLGVDDEKIFVSGDLKLNIERLKLTDDKRKYYHETMGLAGSKVFIAGSISKNEIVPVMDICKQLLSQKEKIKCIIAPRFLSDIRELIDYAAQLSIKTTLRTDLIAGQIPIDPVDVLILDTFGELGAMYGLADAVFIGGTLSPFPNKPLGQNILEPLVLGIPIVVGSNVKKDYHIVEQLKKVWAGMEIQKSEELANSISFLLSDEKLLKRYSDAIRCMRLFENNQKELRKKLSEIKIKYI